MYNHLRALMVEHGLKQCQVSQMTGISEARLSRRMTGKCYFSTAEIMAISAVLDIAPGDWYKYFFENARRA